MHLLKAVGRIKGEAPKVFFFMSKTAAAVVMIPFHLLRFYFKESPSTWRLVDET